MPEACSRRISSRRFIGLYPMRAAHRPVTTGVENDVLIRSFGHAGDGNVHLCVVRDGRDQQTWERELHDNMEQAYAKAYSYGGVASGEHGIGIAKRPYFLRETAEDNLAVMNTIKTALDPKHTLNDQKSYIVGGK